ncbi:MAG TPA: protein kinase [Blastocatellia bacterium]|nr:protein kinase [Blastocatellia bacterium]
MNPERHQLLTDLLDEALKRQATERAAFLSQACAGDATLRSEVESLIASFEQSPDFIEASALAGIGELFSEEEPMEGRRIGHYQLVRELGRGGMGAVYLAERADEYREKVALKLVKRGMDTEFVVRRFRHERQILASLHHPNIARLLDGGTTEDGLPYFVMEYIEGEPVDEYCDHHNLSLSSRLKLFRTICAAVHYAHQNLVIHRDLKPGNILIAADGTVKLLDFGIARILNPEISQTVEKTATMMRLMTPEYASPEQVRGEQVTTASDVYSLGVILYELLTGHRPYRITSILPSDIERVICEQEPIRPSTAITRIEERMTSGGAAIRVTPAEVSRTRESQPEKLQRRLRGDLDNIVLMALRKEPQRRYASVEHFSEDIRRHLEGLPVTARKDTPGYRAAKFIRRHKVGVGAAALVLLSLVAGLIGTVTQARRAQAAQTRAERRFNDVRKLANSYLFEFHDAIAELQGTTQVRALVVKRALEYLDSLAQEASDDRSLQRELAAAYLKVGDVQGRPGHASLGDKEGALASYRKALAIYESLAAGANDETLRQEMSVSYLRVGDALQSGDSVAALQSYRKGLASASPADRLGVANFHQRIGEMQIATGDLSGATESQRQAMALYEAVAAAQPSDKKAQRSLFINFIKAGNLLFEAGEKKGALPLYQKAVPIARSLAEADPLNARAQRELAACLDKVGNALAATGDRSGALAHYNEAFAIRQKVAAADPKNAELRRDLSISHDKLGEISAASGNIAAALAHYREALRIDSAQPGRDTQNMLDRANSLEKIGSLLFKTGDGAAALDHQQKSRALREEVVNNLDHENVQARRDLASSYLRLGELSAAMAEKTTAAQSRWREALNWYHKAQEMLADLKRRGALNKSDETDQARIAAEIARCEAALKN